MGDNVVKVVGSNEPVIVKVSPIEHLFDLLVGVILTQLDRESLQFL
jgi:hypothetical protein